MDVNMDGSTGSDGTEKSWDHPWCTEEMRNKRREWSLAGDAGLLKHLQRFSENLTTKANETQGALDLLTNRLNETAVFVDNLSNTSLALANTQFIESRVHEDDVEIDKTGDQVEKNANDQELNPADIIASVNESIKEGLRIIDEKYDKVDVVASDSEDEGENALPSVVLRARDPYQDRPLPYVIGTEKWKTSSKIGLESSSSESEQMEEDEEESSSDAESKGMNLLNATNRQKTLRSQLSSASSESNDYNLDSNSTRDTNNGSLRAKSQDTLNIESEPLTPTSIIPKNQNINNGPPSFAEELAKRLGNVLPVQKTVITQEAHDPSINRAKDDLFSQEDEEDVFSSRSDNLFSGGGGLFDDDVPPKWNKSIPKPVKTNMIPPSNDVPPPISSTSTKTKSAFDDLFGDADSEDSDDIFSTKSSKKSIFSNDSSVKIEATNKKYLNSDFMENIGNIATRTPEARDDVKDLFVDEELDEDDLFSTSKSQNRANTTPVDSDVRKKPIGGVSVIHGMDFRSSKLSTKIFRQSSSDSSGSETANPNSVPSKTDLAISKNQQNDSLTDSSLIVVASGTTNSNANLGSSSSSSGISNQSSSTNNTVNSSLGADFQSQMTSTRIKSEEHREGIVSDSLFTGATRVQENTNTSNNVQDDIFDDDDDVFDPPPLPKDDKSSKSKVISLFDDSDSDGELFTSAIPKRQSQKSAEVTKSQVQEKPKTSKKISIFDDDDDEDNNDDDDIFAIKDSPDVDIFSVHSKPLNSAAKESTKTFDLASDLFGESRKNESPKVVKKDSVNKSTSIFYDSDENDDLFGSILPKKGNKVRSIFDDDTDSLKSSSLKLGKSANLQEKISVEPENKASDLSNIFQASKGGLFDDEMDDDDLFGHKAPSSSKNSKNKTDDSAISKETTPEIIQPKETKIVSKESKVDSKDLIIDSKESKIESKESKIYSKESKIDLKDSKMETKESIIEPKNSKIEAKVSGLESKKMPPIIPQKPDNLRSKGNATKEVESKTENVVDGCCVSKSDPPNSLNIRPLSLSEEGKEAPRRAVSGKIKNLMGKMGDLKILSPTDTPPVLRKNEEKNEEDESLECDSEDGGSLSIPSSGIETSVNEDMSRKDSSESMLTDELNTEKAISFDEPVHVETLSNASKSRARIQVKRRPQSRQARQTALRQSGIDFDAVDSTQDLDDDTKIKDHSSSVENVNDSNSSSERLLAPTIKGDKSNNAKNTELNLSLAIDDKSERTLSKESTNKNTLLSPSTDEEDLFDVPPDLPEDPFKEDSLFGRAPILSPVDDVVPREIKSVKINTATPVAELKADSKDKELIKRVDNVKKELKPDQKLESPVVAKSTEPDSKDVFSSMKENKESPLDPLRNKDLDPLEDPSQLFAFVTKTPSPEKGKALLFNEDDSLFKKKTMSEKPVSSTKKIDSLFDDEDGDLFSTSLGKNNKKLLKDTKISLFDDENENDDDSLFGSSMKKKGDKNEDKKTEVESKSSTAEKNIFESDSDEHLFSDGTRATIPKDIASGNKKKSNLNDIFGDQSSGDEDIFSFKKTISKKPAAESKSLFNDDDVDNDDDDIFAKTSSSLSKNKESQAVKKVITRDLKKTAEQIVEDPLSLLQED